MISPGNIKILLKSPHPLPLYTAAFFQSAAGGIWFVAMPFVIKRLGGSDTQLGLCLGIWFVAYLSGCLTAGGILDRFNARNSVRFGAAANVVINIGILITVIIARGSDNPASLLWLIMCLSALSGLLTAFFWPPLMGWLSTGYEGAQLNRRLGRHNTAWSFGALVTPYLGGVLVERSSVWPFAVIIGLMVSSFAVITLGKGPGVNASNGDNGSLSQTPSDAASALLPCFRWMARIALLTSFVCIGLLRTQLAVLLKYELGFMESQYGTGMMIMCLASFVVFIAAGKWHRWHYKLSIFIIAQLLLLASMLMILKGSSLGIFFLATGLVGAGQAFMYNSHLYYGVSGGTRRSRRMAIHEFLLSAGFVIGSLAGGFLSDQFGPLMPYRFGLGVVALGLFLQLAIWFGFKRKSMGRTAIQ